MEKECWPAHYFQKQNIVRPSTEDCLHELQRLQNDLPRASHQAGYEYGKVVTFVRQYLPEYDELCNLPDTANHLPQYADHLLQEKYEVVQQLMQRLSMVEISPNMYQLLPYDDLNIASPVQAFHLRLLQSIRNNILTVLKKRRNKPKKEKS